MLAPTSPRCSNSWAMPIHQTMATIDYGLDRGWALQLRLSRDSVDIDEALGLSSFDLAVEHVCKPD